MLTLVVSHVVNKVFQSSTQLATSLRHRCCYQVVQTTLTDDVFCCHKIVTKLPTQDCNNIREIYLRDLKVKDAHLSHRSNCQQLVPTTSNLTLILKPISHGTTLFAGCKAKTKIQHRDWLKLAVRMNK